MRTRKGTQPVDTPPPSFLAVPPPKRAVCKRDARIVEDIQEARESGVRARQSASPAEREHHYAEAVRRWDIVATALTKRVHACPSAGDRYIVWLRDVLRELEDAKTTLADATDLYVDELQREILTGMDGIDATLEQLAAYEPPAALRGYVPRLVDASFEAMPWWSLTTIEQLRPLLPDADYAYVRGLILEYVRQKARVGRLASLQVDMEERAFQLRHEIRVMHNNRIQDALLAGEGRLAASGVRALGNRLSADLCLNA